MTQLEGADRGLRGRRVARAGEGDDHVDGLVGPQRRQHRLQAVRQAVAVSVGQHRRGLGPGHRRPGQNPVAVGGGRPGL